MIYTNNYESPLGSILLAGDEEGLTGLWFTEGSRYSEKVAGYLFYRP